MTGTSNPAKQSNTAGVNALQKEDFPIHRWYRFVLSYPPHLVRLYLEKFDLKPTDVVLDPFCGTGTTLVEAKKNFIPSIGCDAHPFTALASRVKTNWNLEVKKLTKKLSEILQHSEKQMSARALESLSFDAALLQETPNGEEKTHSLAEHEWKLLPTGFLSHRPLQRLLILREEIEKGNSQRGSGT